MVKGVELVRRRRSGGYTLLELCIALALIGAAAWLGTSAYLAFKRDAEDRRLVEGAVTVLQTEVGRVHQQARRGLAATFAPPGLVGRFPGLQLTACPSELRFTPPDGFLEGGTAQFRMGRGRYWVEVTVYRDGYALFRPTEPVSCPSGPGDAGMMSCGD